MALSSPMSSSRLNSPRDVPITLYPSLEKCLAASRPIPLEAPVTRTILLIYFAPYL